MKRERALKVVLVVVGLIFLFAVYPLMVFLWPSGWRWQKRTTRDQSEGRRSRAERSPRAEFRARRIAQIPSVAASV